jgi:hypothetical protein
MEYFTDITVIGFRKVIYEICYIIDFINKLIYKIMQFPKWNYTHGKGHHYDR